MDEPLTVQRQRDRHAQDVVKSLHDENATAEQALQLLEDTCLDRTSLDFAPHLVTAMREAGWMEIMHRAELLRAAR